MLERLGFPRVGDHRRFVTAIIADTIGSGLFQPITLLYFLKVTDLSLVRIGAALSLSALLAMPAAFVIGTLVDRFGGRAMMLAGNVLQAVGMIAYLWVDQLWPVALAAVVVNIGRQSFYGSYGNVVTAITRPGEREIWFGFLQALRNLGYAVGGVLAGIALQIGTVEVFHAVVIANTATFVIAFLLLLGVPDHRSVIAPTADGTAPTGGWGVVLTDLPYLRLVAGQLTFVLGIMVLSFALPVYAVENLGLPGWIVGAMFTLNTVMVGLGQGLVVRWMKGRVRSRMMVLAQACYVIAYAVFVLAGFLPVWLAVAVMIVGAAVYTSGELTGSPVFSATTAEAAPDHLRGRYLGLVGLTWSVGGAIAPWMYTGLLAHGRYSIWAVTALVALVGAAIVVTLPRVLPRAGERVTAG